MAGFDNATVTFSDQIHVTEQAALEETTGVNIGGVKDRLKNFILNFTDDDNIFVYHESLKNNVQARRYHITVDLTDLGKYDDINTKEKDKLMELVRKHPTQVMPQFDEAALEIARDQATTEQGEIKSIQVLLTWSRADMSKLRAIKPENISSIVCVRGICVSATKVKAKYRNCRDVRDIPVRTGLSGADIPRQCVRQQNQNQEGVGINPGVRCPLDPYIPVPDRSSFIDLQTMKMQEYLEDAPAGDMPRHMELVLERNLVDTIVPGSRVRIIGVLTVFNQENRGRTTTSHYLRVLGLDHEQQVGNTGGASRSGRALFSEQEEEHLSRLARSENIYEMLAKSLAPSIHGHDDIKKALVVQLFGAPRVQLPDGPKLRGDIHMLLLGDPGTAKSQLLKFAERVSPVSVYTSGKGSSAAGLTASVVRDPMSKDFYLEGGAMVLSDGGVCCIDEFDKMRDQDRVAIHEAMEQQTISIAKAGITTILNSRTAVLAAANPAFGRFRDDKTAAENIEFESTILSRFDVIFLVKDDPSREVDERIARHVLMNHAEAEQIAPDGEIPIDEMKRLIQFCKARYNPALDLSAAQELQNYYAALRAKRGGRNNVIPITVRQLQGIIRLSIGLARMRGSDKAEARDVNEAKRLFQQSTQNAAENGVGVGVEKETVERMKGAIKDNLGVGNNTATGNMRQRLVSLGFKEGEISFTLGVMEAMGDIQVMQRGARIKRLKDYDFSSMLASEILRVFLSDFQNTLSGQIGTGTANLKAFSAFEARIGDSIKGSIAPIINDLATHRGVNYAFVVIDGDVAHSTTALDKLGVVANLEPLLTLASDTLQYQGDVPIPCTITLSSERVKHIVCRNERFCLVVCCRPFSSGGTVAAVEETRDLLSRVMKVVSGLSRTSDGTVGHAGRHLYGM